MQHPLLSVPTILSLKENVPTWMWMRTGDFGKDAGTINELQDGENVMMIWTRAELAPSSIRRFLLVERLGV